ncbi:DDB1- and CUL4-associated factor 11 isoform X1 [Hydra vulgaris]|uniref:DDB1-and CUL4-associated factor 11 n=1 Tax=Hydra vulgaris TaxID=6087 RepID=T2M9B3_HYDVU|nr:DDB1- and CUL4-associated factor 11 isoform X1 [Hydra vulgaris]
MEEDNSNDSSESNDEITEPGSDLASILSFLLQSGQVTLMRDGYSGGYSVSLRNSDGNTSNDNEDSVERRGNKSPLPNECLPDTSVIDNSTFKEIVSNDSGVYNESPQNILQRVFQRESGCLKKRSHFLLSDQAVCSKSYLPNVCKVVANYRSKAFCGLYSSDGNVFMSACQDQHIRLYDTTNGKFKMFHDIIAKDVGWSIVDASYSPDQNYIIYSSWSEYVHLCNVYGDYETHLALDLKPQESRFCAFSVCFSQDSKEILAGGSDRCFYIYDISSEKRTTRVLAHDDDVNAVRFSNNSSSILISGGDDGICKVWDRRTMTKESPKPVGCFAGHTDGITYVCEKGDGQHFITNSKDQSIKLWDSRRFSSENTIKEFRRLVANQSWDYRWEKAPRRSLRHKGSLTNDAVMTYQGHSVLHTLLRAKFSPEFTTGQRYIYTGCATGSVFIYDVLTGKVVTKLQGTHRQCVRDVSWHPYECNIMSTSWDFTIGKWEYSSKPFEECKIKKKCI